MLSWGRQNELLRVRLDWKTGESSGLDLLREDTGVASWSIQTTAVKGARFGEGSPSS
jgi:hypothetical protein